MANYVRNEGEGVIKDSIQVFGFSKWLVLLKQKRSRCVTSSWGQLWTSSIEMPRKYPCNIGQSLDPSPEESWVEQWSSEWDPRTNSIFWELVRNAKFWTLLSIYWIRNSGSGDCYVLTSSLGDSDSCYPLDTRSISLQHSKAFHRRMSKQRKCGMTKWEGSAVWRATQRSSRMETETSVLASQLWLSSGQFYLKNRVVWAAWWVWVKE